MCKSQKIYDKPDECPVCYEPLDDDKKNLLSCGHWLHYNCLLQSILHSSREDTIKCPICRSTITFPLYRDNFREWYTYFEIILCVVVNLPQLFNSFYSIYSYLTRSR